MFLNKRFFWEKNPQGKKKPTGIIMLKLLVGFRRLNLFFCGDDTKSQKIRKHNLSFGPSAFLPVTAGLSIDTVLVLMDDWHGIGGFY